MKRLIPADTVDAAGNVWETTGENVRKGIREIPEAEVRALVDILFPVGSIYAGDSDFIMSIGKWENIPYGANRPLIYNSINRSGTAATSPFIVGEQEQPGTAITLRLWKRVF